MSRIEDRLHPLRSLIVDAALNPLHVAGKIVHVIDTWSEQDKADAQGATPDFYVRSCFGSSRGISFWRRRHNAVLRLGPECSRYIDHEVAVYTRNVPDHFLTEVKTALHKKFLANHRIPITLNQARPLIRGIVAVVRRIDVAAE
jgi:hypothetical protein